MSEEQKQPEVTEEQLVVAAASLRAVESAYATRLNYARAIGLTFNDLRDTWGVLGYPEVITADMYRARYARGGVAGRVVDALAKATWRGDGDIEEDDDQKKTTKFEAEWDAMNENLKVWSTLMRAHILANLSSFSVLLLGAPGDLTQELPKGKPGQILYLQPFGGGVVDTRSPGAGRSMSAAVTLGADARVAEWDQDSKSPRFGQPLSYQLRRTSFTDATFQRPVHWSRVIHIPAPGFLDDAVFGPPALQGVWNYLLDLDKVAGGGSEAFWMRANAGLHIDIDKKMQLPAGDNTVEKLREQAEAYEHQMSRIIRTRGVNINQLGSDVADFSNPVDVLLTLIAGTTGIPKRILTGSEMGELASTQDRDNWNDQIRDCRTGYAQPVILRQFIERLVDYGYLTKPAQWKPIWPDVGAMSAAEKLDAAVKAATLNDHGEVVITGDEIRKDFLGKDPLDLDEIEGEEDALVDRLEAAIRKGATSLSIAIGKPGVTADSITREVMDRVRKEQLLAR